MAKRDGQGALVLGAFLALFFLARQRGEVSAEPEVVEPPVTPSYTHEGFVYVEGEGWMPEAIAREAEALPPSVAVPPIEAPVIPMTGIETPGIPTSAQVEAPGSALPSIVELVAQRMAALEEAGY